MNYGLDLIKDVNKINKQLWSQRYKTSGSD